MAHSLEMTCLDLVLLGSLLSAGTSANVALSGRILGASGEHSVHVALWEATGFLEHPARQIRMEPGTELTFHFDVQPGRWALSAYEDRNENGILDMGRFGPTEPSGFWRPFHGWRKPKFDEVAAVIDRNVDDANIRLE